MTGMIKFIVDFIIFFMLGPGILILLIYRLILKGALRRFFLYERKDSFFHRLDPRAKIFWTFMVAFLASILEPRSPVGLAFMLILLAWIVLMWYESKPTRDKALTALILLIPIPINSVFYQSIVYGKLLAHQGTATTVVYTLHPWFHWIFGYNKITVEGALYGLYQSLRVLIGSASGLLLAVATPPNALLLGLTSFIRYKDKRFGLPYILSFATVIAIRLIPTIFEDASTIITAQRARGLVLSYKGSRFDVIGAVKHVARVIKYLTLVFVPLVITSLRRGLNLAIAADLRAFRAKPNRTYLIERKFKRSDWIFTIITLAFLLTGIILAYLGLTAPPGGVI